MRYDTAVEEGCPFLPHYPRRLILRHSQQLLHLVHEVLLGQRALVLLFRIQSGVDLRTDASDALQWRRRTQSPTSPVIDGSDDTGQNEDADANKDADQNRLQILFALAAAPENARLVTK